MEPFGLFSFLQSLLTKPEQKEGAENAQNDSQTAPETEGRKDIETPPPPAESSQKAILSFMQAHDERAKRSKK